MVPSRLGRGAGVPLLARVYCPQGHTGTNGRPLLRGSRVHCTFAAFAAIARGSRRGGCCLGWRACARGPRCARYAALRQATRRGSHGRWRVQGRRRRASGRLGSGATARPKCHGAGDQLRSRLSQCDARAVPPAPRCALLRAHPLVWGGAAAAPGLQPLQDGACCDATMCGAHAVAA